MAPHARIAFLLAGLGAAAGLWFFSRSQRGAAVLEDVADFVGSVVNWSPPSSAAPYLPAIDDAEQRYGIPHNLLARVAYQESRFRPDIISGAVVSAAGALGLMQIVPRFHPDVDALDPFASIDYAGKFLRQLYRQFGDWKLALAAYNWGPGNLSGWLKASALGQAGSWPRETTNYVEQISKDVLT